MTQGSPSVEAQRVWWDEWNRVHRSRELDDLGTLANRQADKARDCAARLKLRGARILDLGCGTGWLGASLREFGEVTGTDLSPAAIERGRELFPGLDLRVCDFGALELIGTFDLVVSADVIAHVADQEAFVDRVAALLKPGGTFLLMTQNPFVWNRSSYLAPKGEGQIRDWPSLGKIRRMLGDKFTVRRVSTIEPGGDRGWLMPVRLVMNRHARKVPGHFLAARALEFMRAGRELVVESVKR